MENKVVLKVNVIATERGCKFESAINGNRLADVRKSNREGRYIAFVGSLLCSSFYSYSEAYLCVVDNLKYKFGYFGIDVEFVDVEG